MSTTADIAVRNGRAPAQQETALAIYPGQVTWDDTQLAALAQLGLKDASDGDRAVFLHQCQRTGLDPFARQIYMIPRPEKLPDGRWGKKWTIQTGIEGWRVIRDRAERREGVRGILSRFTYYDPDGDEHKVWVRPQPPVACEVTYTVRDSGGTETPYTSVLRFSEYVQTREQDGKRVASAQWAPDAKPVHMLEKCTEADVYRKAFPQDFAGVHLDDAMPPPGEDAPAPPQRVTREQVRARRTVASAAVPEDTPPAPPHRPPAAADPPAPGHPPGEADGAGGAPAERTFAETVTAIIAHYHRLGWGDSDEDKRGMLGTTARICGLRGLANFRNLTRADADKTAACLAGFDDGDAQGLMDELGSREAVPDGG